MAITGGTGPYRITAVKGLPPGLNVKISSTAISITGVPGRIVTVHCQITVSDAAGATVTTSFVLTI
jgi:hypothetical protein